MTWYRLQIFEGHDKVLSLETDDADMVRDALCKVEEIYTRNMKKAEK